jgi:6-pyruvoyltetrahydropterin/6-carboxytetrahydropterin synthase
MFEIYVKSDFSSAHRLRGYKGKCEALHGHNWKVEVYVSSQTLDSVEQNNKETRP